MDSIAAFFDPARWIDGRLSPVEVDSAQLLYDHMQSQSGRCLPWIYEPFDGTQRFHFVDRGDILDYACHANGGRVLDFGPGDGWPSLPMARYCAEVVGADASAQRVRECAANAARLGVANARFVHVPAGERLPFAGGEFDAVVAASSVEQTPDPAATLAELARVLKPGGVLRLWYEGLARYRGGQEREAWVLAEGAAPSHIVYVVRDIAGERARQWRFSLGLDAAQLGAAFAEHGLTMDAPELAEPLLAELEPHVTGAAVCTTVHPSCAAWLKLLAKAGFTSARPTYGGRNIARHMFGKIDPADRPHTLEETDKLLRAPVQAVVELAAPAELDLMITAVR